MLDTGATALVGAYTATEVARARAAGAHAVKLFPASVGGVPLLRALREPFPDVAFVPTGGVTPDTLPMWLAAGAVAVGAGGSLCPADAVAAGRVDELRRRATLFLDALVQARADV
jgi:2-dehydro-3-deoxyphosphogluconate aldolase/(4S)-4-hydroxy-2-oxoglutarate aldolase